MDWIVGLVVVIILACAIGYIVRAKKRGVKCIGCPAGSTCCSGHCASDSEGCHTHQDS